MTTPLFAFKSRFEIFACAAIAAAGTANCAYGEQEGQSVRLPSEVTAAAISQAQDTLPGSRTLQDQIEQAKSRSGDIQGTIRRKVAALSPQIAGKTADQIRHAFSDNDAVANAEGRACPDTPSRPPADGAGMCRPGAEE